jgi:hypothetical protein
MGKFKVHLKVQALELDIEGDRPDISAISNAVSSQITSMLRPVAALTGGEEPRTPPVIEGETENGKKPGKNARRKPGGSRTAAETTGQAIDFRHDSAKYGNPSQSWSVTEKAIWLLYVLKSIAGMNEVSAPQLLATFNDNFKQAKTIHPPHLTRDLGVAKLENPAPVGEHKGMWYLTDAGDRKAQELIQGVLNPAA